jgi:nucleoside-diphosphate-sugar epimerase
MTNMKPLVLVAGATGMLGKQIAEALLDRGETRVRAMVRSAARAEELAPLVARGLELVEGDVQKAVVSALNNQEELIVDGQTNLLRAAERAGVRRFVPSDFSVDYRPLAMGDNFNLDMRKKFLPVLEASTVEYTLVMNGAFLDILFAPFLEMFDRENKVFRYWGDGQQKTDWTHTSDAAKYVAATVLDPRTANRALMVVGEEATYPELAAAYTAVTGEALRLEVSGTVEELRAEIARRKATAANPWGYLGLQYAWAMASGAGKLSPMNELYPEIRPMGVRAFLRSAV